MEAAQETKGKVAIIGSGFIGRGWAMLFAGAGYAVMMYDVVEEQITDALKYIERSLQNMEKSNLLRGKLNALEQYSLIKGSINLIETIKGTVFIQECVPENIELKRKVWKEIDHIVESEDVIFSSSTSTIIPSSLFQDLVHSKQCIVSHPVNPPYFVPLVELVRGPATSDTTVTQTRDIMNEIGQVPVVCKKEKEGFVLNRMQYALLNECFRLAEEEVMDPEDIDKVMKNGLGMRWAFMGPFETIHLNALDLKNYCERYRNAIQKVTADLGPVPEYQGKTVENLFNVMCEKTPQDKVKEKQHWRDNYLAALCHFKMQQEEKENA